MLYRDITIHASYSATTGYLCVDGSISDSPPVFGTTLNVQRSYHKKMTNGRQTNLHRLTMIAMLSAMAFLLMYFGEIHVPPFQAFLKYDAGDVPAIIATYTLGPGAGVAVQSVKSVLFWLSGKSTAGWVGVLANFLAGAALVLASGLMHRLLGRLGARAWAWGLLSAAVGTVVMALLLIPLNAVLVYPLWGMKGAAAWSGAIYLSTPFNLFKGFLFSVISLALYRRLAPFLMGKASGNAF